VKYSIIRGRSARSVADEVYADGIHILVDLIGNTGKNRMDVFALRPAPVQITYLGYAYTSGLREMDYRITDAVCDHPEISAPFYTEKLLFMKDCFLCFNPEEHLRCDPPSIKAPPIVAAIERNDDSRMLTIGCFSRADKYSDACISFYDSILSRNARVRFLFKAFCFFSEDIREQFSARFASGNRARVEYAMFTDTTMEHISCYNDVDVSIDTMPYSGTTTCCDSLIMGTPMISIYDDTFYFHAHNVSTSIMRNTHASLDFFVITDREAVHAKIEFLRTRSAEFWRAIKHDVRAKFLGGVVCDKARYVTNLERVFAAAFAERRAALCAA
jgi:predicted O-linked N-acetylglucosamine transferase (SPINDLY family)